MVQHTRSLLRTLSMLSNSLVSIKLRTDRDGIMSEHFLHSHPASVIHLKFLFSAMMTHSFVPESFATGVITPIIKDKRADITAVDNYRPITLSSIISKIFEYMLLHDVSVLITSDDLQFGFKPHVGCPKAILLLRLVIDYFMLLR